MEVKMHRAFWRGAVILTLAGLVTKILSAFYRIPFQNIVGDVGFYVYQQVYPFYGICLVLGTYGFPSVISKLIAEENAIGNEAGVQRIVRVSFLFLLVLSLAGFLGLYSGAAALAALMGDSRLTLLLQVVAFIFLLIPFLSVGRGFFQGLHDMVPTALSQVIEQAIRVAVIVVVSLTFVASGRDLYEIGAGAMAGSIAGGTAGAVILFYFWRRKKLAYDVPPQSRLSGKMIVRVVFWQGLAICISNLVLIFIQFMDSISLYNLLVQTGEKLQYAKVLKGVYDRSTPLIQLGTVVATSFALSLIPLITSAKQKGDVSLIYEKVRTSLKITLVVGSGAAVGLACIIRPTNVMLFEDVQGSGVLALLAFSILFGAFSITTASLLQGLDFMGKPAASVMGGAAVKLAGNVLLIPVLGLYGAAVATILGLATTSIWNLQVLARFFEKRVLEVRSAVYIFIAAAGMAVVLFLYIECFEAIIGSAQHRGAASLEAIAGVMIGGAAYAWLILRLPVFSDAELGTVWHGGKLPRVLQMIRKG